MRTSLGYIGADTIAQQRKAQQQAKKRFKR
jgi:hypothetical protein